MVIGTLVTVSAAYFAAWSCGRQQADVSVIVAGQKSQAGEVSLSVIATNQGRVPLIYHGSPPFAELRVETATGWTNIPQRYVSQSASFGFLLPGRAMSYRFAVPHNVTRVQVGCHFETAGAKTWVAGRLEEAGAWNRIYPVLRFVLPLVPDGRQEAVEFWSQEANIQ
jgi:hypothetical protein